MQRFVPEFEKRWRAYAHSVGAAWRVDEPYVRVRGRWMYLYRAVDKEGLTVDFLLSESLDTAAAARFLTKAIGHHGEPEKITLDGYAPSHHAVVSLQAEGVLPK